MTTTHIPALTLWRASRARHTAAGRTRAVPSNARPNLFSGD